jgi:pimeloyl-ACP methyl ester carboxylesterase
VAFAEYGLDPQSRKLVLEEPPCTLRALEVGSGEPALLMHGIALGSSHWTPLISQMPAVRSFVLDMPGHGESQGAAYDGVDLRRWHTQMLAGCLDALGLDSAHIVGYSYGALFAYWLALDLPERVRSIIAIGAPSVGFGARPDLTLRSLAVPGIGRLILRSPMPGAVHRRLLAASLGHPAIEAASPELLRATYLGTRRRDYPRTVSSHLRNQFRGARDEPQRYVLQDRELERIRQPVLVIWGDRDERFQPIAEARRRAASLPRARSGLSKGATSPGWRAPRSAAGSSRSSSQRIRGKGDSNTGNGGRDESCRRCGA